MGSNTDTIQFNSTKTLSVPTKAHYTFEGWYIGNTQITTGNGKMLRNWSIANNDSVLTAKWEAVTYTISFANCETMPPIQVKHNTTITLPTPTSQYKYDTFVSWSFGGNNYTNSFTMPGGNIVMTAQWNNNGWTYISTKDEFRNIASNMSGKYVLLNDIDLGSWTPMGQYYCAKGDWNTVAPTLSGFSGKIDGQGNTISYSITITQFGTDYDYAWGIFGSVNNAEFVDLVVDAQIGGRPQAKTGGDTVAGGITGWAVNSKFDNCTSYGRIYLYETAGQCSRSGGVVGFAQGSTFMDCTNRATVYANDWRATAGGIVGGNGNGNTYKYCTNLGNVSASKGAWIAGKSGYGEIFGPLTV